MATLEDKLLGDKLQYYCSSSEDENGNDEDEDDADGNGCKQRGSCKQGAEGYIDPDVCPPQPGAGHRSQSSTNTGPKGVVQDWQRFKQLQSERREESERQRIALAKKLSMTAATAKEDEERRANEAIDAELAELMSEDFLHQFQKEHMAAMMLKCGQMKQFGKIWQLQSHDEFLECVEKESKHTTIIVHIYDRELKACKTLNRCLDTLATQYPTVKFAKISIEVAGMSRNFRAKGLPALLAYKAAVVVGNFVRLTDDLTDEFFATDVESLLIENGILIDKNLYN